MTIRLLGVFAYRVEIRGILALLAAMNEEPKMQSAIFDYTFDAVLPEQEGTLGKRGGGSRVLGLYLA